MSAGLRRGACPALAAPMPTGDGLLVRLLPVSGGLSPKSLIGLCKSAARHGNGVVEVTARGSLQFRGFSDASALAFAEDVEDLGIAVRVGVPVETGPLAGLDLGEVANPLPVAERIRSAISAAGLAERLGPKVSVVIDGGGHVTMDSVAADARLTSERHGVAVRWRLLIAGDAETATPVALFEEDAAVAAVLTILSGIAERGRDARARDVSASLLRKGPGFSARPTVLPGASLSDGRKGSNSEREAFDIGFPGLVPLRAARATLAVALPFGHTDAARLADFARRAESLGVIEIRPAPRRILLPICPSAEAAEAIRQAAAELDFITEASDPRRTNHRLPGAPACASGKIAARAVASESAKELGDQFGRLTLSRHFREDDLSIHISGCEKGCARQAAADITIVGGENGAGLVVGGTTKAMPVAYRSECGLPRAIAAVAHATMVSRAERADAEPPRRSARRTGPGAADRGIRARTTMTAYDYIRDGDAIYERSFAIIRREADLSRFNEAEADVAIRMIHACGQVEAARHFVFSQDFVEAARTALRAGAPIFCDAEMVAHGVTRARLPAGQRGHLHAARSAHGSHRQGDRQYPLRRRDQAVGRAHGGFGRRHRQRADRVVFPARTVCATARRSPPRSSACRSALSARPNRRTPWPRTPIGVPFAIVRGRLGGSAMTAACINALARAGL